MLDRGAKNLVLLSRNTDSLSPGTLRWLQELRESKGTLVRVEKCDISDENQLASSLAAISTDMPPIKGVIHGGMVLRVSVIFHSFLLPVNIVCRYGSNAIVTPRTCCLKT